MHLAKFRDHWRTVVNIVSNVENCAITFMFMVLCITSWYQMSEMQQYAVYILFYCKITLHV